MPSESNSENNIESQTQNEGLIKDKYEAILKETQSIISIFYILAVAIGMLFNYQKYSEFGINIFDYADIFEFLVAPFSDVIILFFTIGSCLFIYLFFKFDTWLMKKHPNFYSIITLGWDKKTWYDSNRYILFISMFFLFLYSVADFYGRLSSQKTKEQTPITLRFVDNEIKKGIIIGNTKQVIFFLEGEKVKAIPFTAIVKEFEIKK
ncbi:hypothetical protein Fleli_2758 [Bernardetia litoralis DSM 6794]|uniref:Uncharacterized protein n=1 Tax=Bernardetia litoralis (strain ATCC 23117 / DSM 6794 / NBRC 15988 / NCIMB 1366 / Fx l1 / Sio-4) TaxID=880071 RepID=I4AMC6_BERLS|nr:hypothetical protein [Bernardetia litoralis]AFM05111.1 hypothetical protein Fleli_2758 [Bernardetia litoralis DSM 6794]